MERDDETTLGAKNRRKLEKIGRQIAKECGAELPKIKNKKIKGGNGKCQKLIAYQ